MRVIGVASNGGHLIQLTRLENFFSHFSSDLITTSSTNIKGFDNSFVVSDVNKNSSFLEILKCFYQCFNIIRLSNAEIIITTGAFPGLLSVIAGRLLFKKTVWIDSIANANKLSASGKLAKFIAHYCLTQWEHLADGNRVLFLGKVL